MTDYRLRYPGTTDWAEVVNRLRSEPAMDPLDVTVRIHEAVTRGIPQPRALAMLQLYFEWLQSVLAEDSSSRLSSNVATTLDEILRRPPIHSLITQLPGREQLLAWHCLDTIHALRIRNLPYRQRVSQAKNFLDRHPVPAFVTSHTALPSVDFDSIDDAILGLPVLHFAEEHSDRESILSECKRLRHFQMYRLAVALRDATPRQQRTLRELLAFDEWLTSSVLGADYVAQKIGILSALTFGRKAAVELIEQRAKLLDRLHGIVALDACEYGWAYSHYLMGRIDLGCGEPKASEKEFKKALERGFAAYPAVMHLAHAHNFRKKYDLTRALLEEWAPRFGIRQGHYSRGSTDTIADAYETAGGDPAILGSSGTESQASTFRDDASENAKRFLDCAGPLGEQAKSATMRFWEALREQTFAYIASALTADHVDIALDPSLPDTSLRLSHEQLARLNVEDNPALKPLDPSILVAAVDGSVSARAVAFPVLQHLRVLEVNPRQFSELACRIPALAVSYALAAQRIDRAIQIEPAITSSILAQYYSDFHWNDMRSTRLFTHFADACGTRGLWDLLAAACDQLRQGASDELVQLIHSTSVRALDNLLRSNDSLAGGTKVAMRLLALNDVSATQIVWHWWTSRDGENLTTMGRHEAIEIAKGLLSNHNHLAEEPRAILCRTLFQGYLQELSQYPLGRTPARLLPELEGVQPAPRQALSKVVEWFGGQIDLAIAQSHLEPRDLGAQIDTMLWAHEQAVDEPQRTQVRQKIVDFCRHTASRKWPVGIRTSALERIAKRMPDEHSIQDLYRRARGEQRKQRVRVALIVTSTLLVTALTVFLLHAPAQDRSQAPTEPVVSLATRTTPNVENSIPEHCRTSEHGTSSLLVCRGRMSWSEALEHCSRLGATLASVGSPDAQDAIDRALDAATESRVIGGAVAWIGGTDHNTEGQFRWADGMPFEFTHWQPGDPNNGGDSGVSENCLATCTQGAVQARLCGASGWSDLSCDATTEAVVCRKLYIQKPVETALSGPSVALHADGPGTAPPPSTAPADSPPHAPLAQQPGHAARSVTCRSLDGQWKFDSTAMRAKKDAWIGVQGRYRLSIDGNCNLQFVKTGYNDKVYRPRQIQRASASLPLSEDGSGAVEVELTSDDPKFRLPIRFEFTFDSSGKFFSGTFKYLGKAWDVEQMSGTISGSRLSD